MALTTDILFKWKGDSSDAKKAAGEVGSATDEVGTKSERVGKKMQGVGKKMAGLSVAIVGVFALGAKSLAENEVLLAQTESVLTSMGGAANVTSDDVFDLANSISGMSGVAHESIVEGENMLLTFGNIHNELGEGNDIFDQTTALMVDMSVAMGTDVKAGAIQLGKALNDPITGVGALSKVGITFTEDQKEMIKGMVESGDVMGAQKIILKELENQFGGSAAAMGETMTGKINIMKNSFEEMARTLATAVMPMISKFVGWLQSALSWFNNLNPGMQKMIQMILGIVAAIAPMLLIGAKLVTAFNTIKIAMAAMNVTFLANPFVLLGVAIVALVVLVVLNWDKIVDFMKAAWEKVKEMATAVWQFLKDIFKAALDFLVNLVLNWTLPGLIFQHWDTIKKTFFDAIEIVKGWFKAFVDFFILLWQTTVSTVQGVFTAFIDFWKTLWQAGIDFVKTIFTAYIDFWKATFKAAIDFIKSVFSGFKSFFSSAWSGLWNGVKAVFTPIVNFIKTTFDNFIKGIKEIWNTFKALFRGDFRVFWDGIKRLFVNVFDSMKNIGARFFEIGKAIIDGIIKGLGNIVSKIFNALKKGIQDAINAVKRFFGMRSPSLVFAAQIGAPMMQGVAKGVADEERNTAFALTKSLKRASAGLALTTPGTDAAGFGGFGAATAGGLTVHVHIAGSVVSEEDLANKLLDRIQILMRHRP